MAQMADQDAAFTNYFRREADWTAGDATISIPLPGNKILWLFGDSHINGYQAADTSLPCQFQVRNAAMVQEKSHPDSMITLLGPGQNRTLFKLYSPEPPHHYFWPGHGYATADTVYIFLNRYRDTVEIINNDSVPKKYFLGTYLAKMTLPNLELAGIVALPDRDGIVFGRWVLLPVESNYAFIYGNRLESSGALLVWKPYVARVLSSNPLGPWQFRTASGWSTNPQSAVTLCPAYGVSPGFSVCQRSGRFYLFTQENGYLECGKGRKIYAIGGMSTPWGVFSERVLLYTIENKYDEKYLMTYNTYAHPEWTNNAKLLLSYNVNDKYDKTEPNICPSQCRPGQPDRMNADTYRPKFIRVPWSDLINGTPPSAQGSANNNRNAPGDNVLDIRCSPNPAKDFVEVGVPLETQTSVRIDILDLTGRLLYQEPEEEREAGYQRWQIAVQQWPAGIYLVRVRAGGQESVRRLIRQ